MKPPVSTKALSPDETRSAGLAIEATSEGAGSRLCLPWTVIKSLPSRGRVERKTPWRGQLCMACPLVLGFALASEWHDDKGSGKEFLGSFRDFSN